MSFTLLGSVAPLLIPLEICPLAPPGIQTYVDQIVGYVLFAVTVIFFSSIPVAIGGLVLGLIFHIPRATVTGVIALATTILAAVLYQVGPGIVAAVIGTGCVG